MHITHRRSSRNGNDTNGTTPDSPRRKASRRAERARRENRTPGGDGLVASGRYITCVLPAAVLNARASDLSPLHLAPGKEGTFLEAFPFQEFPTTDFVAAIKMRRAQHRRGDTSSAKTSTIACSDYDAAIHLKIDRSLHRGNVRRFL